MLPVLMLIVGCEDTTGPDDGLEDTPIAIYLISDADTLLLLTENTASISARGVFTETSEHLVTNTGVLADTSFIYETTDTLTKSIKASQLDWFSSDLVVASVAAGKIKAKAAGMALIWAAAGDVVSNRLTVVVSSPELPPELIIDPPPVQLIFQDSVTVSGRITAGLDATLKINSDTTDYDTAGRFGRVVNLVIGDNNFSITAINNQNGLSVTKSKRIIFLPIATAGITGLWEGETLTRPFSFDIYELLGVYIIDGTLTVDFTLLGGSKEIRDIVIAGLINSDGTISASLSKEQDGFVITGTLDGVFLDSGMSEGSYGIKLEKDGWPTASAKADWWATRQ
ncbi:MAG: hypothetical protein ABIA75_03510 [Candidatus Neomarinimicrobiota bacterium]